MFKKILLVIIVSAGVLIWLSNETFKEKPDQPDSHATPGQKIIYLGNKKLSVDIADDIPEQIQGLSGRESLAKDSGMLFIFQEPQTPGFWMKEMKFSIDIVWISADGVVIGVQKNLTPETYPQLYSPRSPIKYVLEVSAGWFDQNHVKIGDKLQFPN